METKNPNLVDCQQMRKDCVCRNKFGQCVALSNTTFKRSDGTRYSCPFFKSRQEVWNENH